MSIKHIQTLVVFTLLSFTALKAQHYPALITRLNYAHQEQIGATFAIAEDKNGFIWFGTTAGLIRYDGYNYKTYRNKKDTVNTLSNNTVRSLLVDKNGILWIGTQGGGLNKLNPETEEFEHFVNNPTDNSTISNNEIWAITQDSEGYLWLGTWGGGVNKFDTKTGKVIRYQFSEKLKNQDANVIRSVFSENDSIIWVGTHAYGAIKLNTKNNQITWFKNEKNNPESLSNNAVYHIFKDKSNLLWLCTFGGGINQYIPASQTFKNFSSETGNPNTLSGNNAYHMIQNQAGNYWIACNGSGITIINNQFRIYNHIGYDPCNIKSLTSNRVNVIFEDSNGILWVGSESGVDKIIENRKFKHFTYTPQSVNSLNSNVIRSIYQDSKQKIWIGAYDVKLLSFNPETNNYEKSNKIIDKVGLSGVTSITEDEEKNFWIGTSKGLFYFDKNYNFLNHFTSGNETSNTISDNTIQTIRNGNNGDIWIGTENGLNQYNIRTKQWNIYKNNPDNPKSISSNKIQPNALIIQPDNVMWIGTWSGGLNKYNPETKTFENFMYDASNSNSINNNNIISLCKQNDSILWIGTFGGGLNKLNTETKKFTAYTEANGLASNVVYAIINDTSQNLWISTDNGITKLNTKNNTFLNFTKDDGLQENQFFWGSSFKSKSGEIFFGGINGITAFYPENIVLNTHKPHINIIDIKLFNESIKDQLENIKRIILPYYKNNLTIEFAALDYTDPQHNRYAYRFLESDTNWIQLGSRNFISFSNLPPGKYKLQIIGSNSDMQWNTDGVVIDLTITPPFWKTWLFRIALIIIVLIGFYAFYRYRIYQVKKHNLELEHMVKVRTSEVLNQKEEIEQQKEELISQSEKLLEINDQITKRNDIISVQNKHIQDSIKAALTIQKAILPIFQKLDEYFENFIIFKPKDIVSGDFYWATEIQTETINYKLIAVVDCTGHGVPGAFMSMISYSILNEIVLHSNITDTHDILNILNKRIIQSLQQTENANSEGLDICLIRYNTTDKKIQYSGAKLPLYIFSATQQQLLTFSATRKSIGGIFNSINTGIYSAEEIELQKADVMYLCSDGYSDQNNLERKRFGRSTLAEKLTELGKFPMQEQKTALISILDTYMEGSTQRDDITLIGLKLK